jgi:hypothetical protein
MLFRVMFGAGMIKMRGDACWRDLTCLDYHFETQPLPNPLSWSFHHLPHAALKIGVLFNHFAELIAPFFLFIPGPWRAAGGLIVALFQANLILSGNLSWLNYLTIVLCIPCFDDRYLIRLLPEALSRQIPTSAGPKARLGRRRAIGALVAVAAWLSIAPTMNILSPRQAMNASFEPFHLVNTYGAFGSVGQERRTVVFSGTEDARPDASAHWTDYEYKCQPTDPSRRPCWLSPYQLRLDWQVWFLQWSRFDDEPWLTPLVRKLLEADPGTLSLFASDPFGGRRPRWVRATLYRYRFTDPGEPGWWVREPMGTYLPPVSLR